MRAALVGYGKMGKAIEGLGLRDGVEFVEIIDRGVQISSLKDQDIDVAIEFTQPESAFDNIKFCLESNIKIISGTTGWLSRLQKIKKICDDTNGTFLHASNFSVGVNLFFELNEWLSKKTAFLNFMPEIEEVHHTEKKDSPSGTAITLAEGTIKNYPNINSWINEKSTNHQKLGIISERKPNVPGTHTVTYSSNLETMKITHVAHDRGVFAEGVVKAAKWINSKSGFLTMSDFINDQ
ncbi:MAG: 4-hydroxy-tetrahydrodipicolinate reductase [Ekhidna sp.]|nr:4-hydroxy-tetrahydrodipicolinate reductase [Ekhidna sp.]